VTEEKGLGVIISEDLEWEKQCSSAVSKSQSQQNRPTRDDKANFLADRRKQFCYCIKAW